MSENYVELYKKYRPNTWEQVIGQEHVVESLRKAVLNNSLPTGYLFGGGPGTGKTTAAFILAKALNCENLTEDGNPCNECETCKAIDNGSLPGVNYVSMANNGGVEEVRQMVNQAKLYQPIKKQVWILDEIQNISAQAFDALLIPLEDDNMKTLFIMCTTEPEKVRPAVLSRLQIRNFRPVSEVDIAKNLYNICKQEGWGKEQNLSNAVLKDIAYLSNGSVRNSISGLETFIHTGVVKTGSAEMILKSILSKDISAFYQESNNIKENGDSYPQTLEIIYEMILKTLINISSKKNLSSLDKVIATGLNGKIMNFIKALDIIADGVKYMTNSRVRYKLIFESTMIKIFFLINEERSK